MGLKLPNWMRKVVIIIIACLQNIIYNSTYSMALDVSLSLSVTVRSSKKLLYAVSLGPII